MTKRDWIFPVSNRSSRAGDPPVYSDLRAAWEGVLPAPTQHSVRIEAAAYRGKPTYFEIIGPWSQPVRTGSPPQSLRLRAFTALFAAGFLALLILGIGVRKFGGGMDLHFAGHWLLTFLLLRVGLLVFVVADFYLLHSDRYPFTLDFSAWYAPYSLLAVLFALAVAVYGFYVSLAGQPLFRRRILSDGNPQLLSR